jgi:hypothetical protein
MAWSETLFQARRLGQANNLNDAIERWNLFARVVRSARNGAGLHNIRNDVVARLVCGLLGPSTVPIDADHRGLPTYEARSLFRPMSWPAPSTTKHFGVGPSPAK